MFEKIKRKFRFIKNYLKLSPEEKQKYKKYKQNLKTTKKKLLEAAKKFKPWDYGFLLDLIKPAIDSFVNYYTLGWNVSGMDDPGCPTRKEISEKLKQIYDKYFKSSNENTITDEEILRAFFTYLGEYIIYLWD